MNLSKIIAHLENHSILDSDTLKQALELHEKFPYTSLFPMIILKGLKSTKDVHFEGELKKLAIQVNDRAVLEKYLEEPEIPLIHSTADLIKEEANESISLATTEEIVQKVSIKDETEETQTKEVIAKELNVEEPILEKTKTDDLSDPVISEGNFEPIASDEKDKNLESEENIELTDSNKATIKEAQKSIELSPETLRIIAEIEKKYGEVNPENEFQSKEKTHLEDDPHIKEEIDQISAEPKENKLEDLTFAEEGSLGEQETKEVDSSLGDDLKEYQEKKRKKKKKHKKKKKEKKLFEQLGKDREELDSTTIIRDEDKIHDALVNQSQNTHFKFKKYKGEDEDYYHLEIDFSDLEPIYYEVEEEELVDTDLQMKLVNPDPEKKADVSKKKLKKTSSDLKKEFQEEQTSSSFQEPVRIEVNEKTEMTFLDWLKANKNSQSPKEERQKKANVIQRDVLIEKFIEDEPRISKSKKEFFSPTKNAKKSLQDDMEIVSETLADLHVYQGSYAKAKKLYEKLILKFPEKKSLFAKKLEEISELEKKN
ncbi:MAG: hypothetical protein R2799_06440 [Crocinitomicaceae bacterium]